jgi:xanthine dehydrogenase/oxidase
VEIGQGINTKVVQAVAMALGIDLSLIRVEKTSTDAVVNGGCTGGSGTSEVVVQAALNACKNLNDRLAPYRQVKSKKDTKMNSDEWISLLQSLPFEVSLNVEGWFSPNDNPNHQVFQYFVYAACVTEVEFNVLSGEVHVLACEIVYDCGRSLNPAIDIGQIEGGLLMGIGYFFQEKVSYTQGSGLLKTVGTWEYKPPMAQDIPSVLNVTLIANDYNTEGILGSKAVGEPPYVVSNSAYFALKQAIASARSDAGVSGYYDLPVPATVDVRQSASLVSSGRFLMPC